MKFIIFIFLITFVSFTQVKDDISIVQFSAEFVKTKEISLTHFKDYNTQTLYLTKNQEIFKKEKIKSLPTIILYNDGKEVIKIDGGIRLALPEDTIKRIQKHIDSILESRF
tara:strand:+ start:23586 stop:23918 length:333 start_codon:yes stop_codon:yes gene_type:complete